MKITKAGRQKEGKETQMNLLAVKPCIEAYGIYLPLFGGFIFLHSFLRRRRQRGLESLTWSRWGLKRSASGSSWPERNFWLAAMMGEGGELPPPAPSPPFFATNCLAPALVPCHLKSPQVHPAKKPPGVASQFWLCFTFLSLSETK